jgi:Zn-dependent protease with chaperone function
MATAAPALRRKPTALTALDPSAFRHPLDRQATDQLKKLRGFDKVMAKFIEYGVERIDYVKNIGGAVRVGPRQLPQLYEMLHECCRILDVPEPEFYIGQGDVNAFTSGHNHPYIVVMTGLLELMDDDEVMAVIAHEVGHIKCGHVLYKQMARGIVPLLGMIGKATLGLGSLIGMGIEAALLTWDRRSELSADRAALLVTQDAHPCVSMLMKLAGGTGRFAGQLDSEQFLNQARTYGEGLDQSMLDRFYRFIVSSGGSHPFPVERARALDEWIDSEEYKQILAGDYPRLDLGVKVRACPTCGQPAEPAQKFCAQCGTPLVTH